MGTRKQTSGRRLTLENLEQRRFLTTWTVLPDIADGEEGSLRQRITESNSNNEDDTIVLIAGTYRMTLEGGDNDNLLGDFDLAEAGHSLNIRGAGTELTIIEAGDIDRIFDILTDVNVTISDLTIRGGKTDSSGGAIRNSGELTLEGVRIESCIAQYGGGIFSVGRATIIESTIANNEADLGGGIANLGELVISASTITGNQADEGAGVWNGIAILDKVVREEVVGTSVDTLALAGDLWMDDVFLGSSRHSFSVDVGSSFLYFKDASAGADYEFERSFVTGTVVGDQIQAGTLTAGTIDDYLDVMSLVDFASGTLVDFDPQAVNVFEVAPVTIYVENTDAVPIGNARVVIRPAGSDTVVLDTFTSSDGRTLFLPAIDAVDVGTTYEVTVHDPEGEATQQFTGSIEHGEWRLTLDGAAQQLPTQLDVALVIDVTGSMADELEYLKVEIDSIAAEIHQEHPYLDIRFSLVVYRDQGDAFVTRTYDFVNSVEQFQATLAAQFATGGGDYPEAMHVALKQAEGLSWRDGNTARVLFLVADAPPHSEHAHATIQSALQLRQQGVHIYPVGASGVGNKAEAVMRTAAFVTMGEYLFLTDHSGVGLSHAQPHTESYDVERLDQAMLRMIQQELNGEKLAPAEVIDRVRTDPLPGIVAGSLELINSTISTNDGAGLHVENGTATVNNTTVVDDVFAQGDLDIQGSIIDGTIDGDLTSHGFNLFSAEIDTADDSDIVATDPRLGPLQDNGGPTWTHLPLADSPVIDVGGPANELTIDQRGRFRTLDGDGDGIRWADVGSVEADEVPSSAEGAIVDFRIEITDSDGKPIDGIVIGETIDVSFYVEDLRDDAAGVFAAYIDLLWVGASFDVDEIQYADTYDLLRTGAAGMGQVDELGAATTSLTPLGPERALVATVTLTATSAGFAEFVVTAADDPAHTVLVYGIDDPIDSSQVRFGTAAINVEEPAMMAVATNPRMSGDVNGDGLITLVDVMMTINAINRRSDSAKAAALYDSEGPSLTYSTWSLTRDAEVSATRPRPRYYDVNADGVITPLDVLQTINAIERAEEEAKTRIEFDGVFTDDEAFAQVL